MEYATMLADPNAGTRVANLRANERTVIVPVVNVDGFVATRQDSAVDPNDNNPAGQDPNVHLGEAVAPPGGILAYRRKNCDGEFPSPNVPCELQWGIDNNRNYGNLWGGPGSSQDPTSQSFHGPGPRSEPETQAVWNYARTHQVTFLMTLHNVAALVLRPPGLHDGGKAPDEDAHEADRRRDGRRDRLHVAVRLPALRHGRHDRGRHVRGHGRLRLHDRDRPEGRHVPRALPAGLHRPVGARRRRARRRAACARRC